MIFTFNEGNVPTEPSL